MSTSHITTGENKGARQKTLITRVLAYAFLIFVSLLALFPLYILIVNSTRSGAQIQAGFSLLPGGAVGDNLFAAWTDTNMVLWRGLLNSFIIAIISSILTCYFSAMTAYGIHVYDFKGRNVAFKFILLIMTIPTQVAAVGFIALVRQVGLDDTYWPL
ncbi:MAG: carbohydrate ABC transporter permease, partial [Ruminiclostridium sp.]|nr:carbohydrate ABC transporter permease [Ruminiclostridium sp.]